MAISDEYEITRYTVSSGTKASSASGSGTSSGNTSMRRALPATYSFIPNDDTYDKKTRVSVL